MQEQREQLNQPSKVIATVKLGADTYLLREDAAASIAFEYIDTAKQSLQYLQATRTLPEQSKVTFDGVDASRTTIAQIGLTAPTIRWRERTSGVDEPTLTFAATDSKKNVPASVDLHEQELHDLFLKQPGKEASAAFFTIDTAEHELIGIALKREFPVLLSITPGKDGVAVSPAEGLNTMLKNIYEKLTERLSPFQADVEEKVYQAVTHTNAVQFQFDTSTPARKRQRDIQKYIYQIQTLLLAMKAEAGQGIQDPALLAHAPFLKAPVAHDDHGLFGRIFAQPQPHEQVPSVSITNTIWESLVAEPSGKLLVDPRFAQRTVSQQPPVVPARPVTPVPASRVTPPVPSRPEARVTPPPPTPVIPARPAVTQESTPQLSEKDQAIHLSRELDKGVVDTMIALRDLPIDKANFIAVMKFNKHLEDVVEHAKQYLVHRKAPGAFPDPVMATLSNKDGSINVSGIKNGAAYGYLTGQNEVLYSQKITEAFKAWNTYVEPFYVNVTGQDARTLSAVQRGIIPALNPDITHRLQQEWKEILQHSSITVPAQTINIPELSHLLLSGQVLYALREQYLFSRRSGKAEDIDAWAAYSFRMVNLWKSLIPNAAEKKKRLG